MSGQRYSLRKRLVNRTMLCMLLVLGGISFGAHLVARYESGEIFGARLANSARVLSVLVGQQLEMATISRPIEIPLPHEIGTSDDNPTPYGHPYEHKIAFQVWSNDGRLLAKSASAPHAALSPFSPGFSESRIDDELWQVFALRSGSVWVLAAEKDEVREEMVSELGTSVLVPVFIGGVLMLLAVNFILSSNLAPLRRLADSIARREPESLVPVSLTDIPDELRLVVDELNSLLQRVQAAFEREQRFIDAAAHEIRTPLAAVQLHLQNAMQAQNEQERESSLAEAGVGLKRTTQLAEQLLTLSRLASKTDLALHQQVSLRAVCHETIELLEPLLERRGQTIGLNAPQDYKIDGDPYRLQQLLRNLIDNASHHGAPQGDIEVSIARSSSAVLLQVANDGEPVPDSEIENLFTPYYRLQPGAVSGAGLGLSIVQEIAKQHKARISISRKADDQGCVVSVSFPEPGESREAEREQDS